MIGFFVNNSQNYAVAKDIQRNFVNHPENLPTPEVAKLWSFWFANMAADIYWLQTIQYIWSNVVESEYKKYLYQMIELITELNPYFESPYVIGQLLLPSNENNYDDYSGKNITEDMLEAKALWLKGIKNFCDSKKISAIFKQENLWEIISNPQYKNPCESYKIPYYLAFTHYFYLKEPKKSAAYYKVVAAQNDAPEGAKILAAIMQWRSGEREKSLFMFLSLAQSLASENEACGVLTKNLEQVYYWLSEWILVLNGELIKNIQTVRDEVLPKLTDENEDEILDDTQCSNYLTKAIRELNLLYLQKADNAYILANPNVVSAMNPETLFSEWYIDFIPTDYQQYEDTGIIYRFDDEIGGFDFRMANK